MEVIKEDLAEVARNIRNFLIKEELLNSELFIDLELNSVYVNILTKDYEKKFELFKSFINANYACNGIVHKKINDMNNHQIIDCSLKHHCLIASTWTDDDYTMNVYKNQFYINSTLLPYSEIKIYNLRPAPIINKLSDGAIVDVLEGYYEFSENDKAHVIFYFGDTETVHCIMNKDALENSKIKPKNHFLLIVKKLNLQYIIKFETMIEKNMSHVLINENYKNAFEKIGLSVN